MPQSIVSALKSSALSLGFDLVGITTVEPSIFAEEYRAWIAHGYAGEMGYLTRNLERRLNPGELVPNAKSIIVVGMNYYTREQGEDSREEVISPLSPSFLGRSENSGKRDELT